MKKKLLSLGVCTAAVLLCMIAVLSGGIRNDETMKNDPSKISEEWIHSTSKSSSSQENRETAASVSEEETFLVKEYQGHIGVFSNSSELPFQEIPVDVESLPKTDQLLLAQGIHAANKQELNRVLEDYES